MNDEIKKIVETMNNLGFEHVDRLKFKDNYTEDDVDELDDLDFEVGNTFDEKFDVYIEDDDEFVVDIPEDHITSAKHIMNETNPDVDAHPLALLYIKGLSRSKNSINKGTKGDEDFWHKRHIVQQNEQIFTYDDMVIKLKTDYEPY